MKSSSKNTSIILRLTNVVLMAPTLCIYLILHMFYPIIGYVLGRGFANSIEATIHLLECIFKDPFGALKMPLHIYYILVKGDKKYGKYSQIIIHN